MFLGRFPFLNRLLLSGVGLLHLLPSFGWAMDWPIPENKARELSYLSNAESLWRDLEKETLQESYEAIKIRWEQIGPNAWQFGNKTYPITWPNPHQYTFLHLLAKHNLKMLIQAALLQGAPTHATDAQGQTPLHWATRYGGTSTVKLLLRHHAAPNPVDYQGYTPLHRAVLIENKKICRALLQRGASPLEIVENSPSPTALHLAVEAQKGAIVELFSKWLQQRHLSPDVGDGSLITPLQLALQVCSDRATEDARKVAYLLQAKSDPNQIDQEGRSPVHQTLVYRCTVPLQILLDHKADPNQANREGEMPLHLALGVPQNYAVCRLLEAGADPNAPSPSGQRPLHLALMAGEPRILLILLEAKADPCLRNLAGDIPLHLACRLGLPYSVWEPLLQDPAGIACMNWITPQNQTALELALISPRNACRPQDTESELSGSLQVIDLLLSKGAQTVVFKRCYFCCKERRLEPDPQKGCHYCVGLNRASDAYPHYPWGLDRPEASQRSMAGFSSYENYDIPASLGLRFLIAAQEELGHSIDTSRFPKKSILHYFIDTYRKRYRYRDDPALNSEFPDS